MKFLPLLLLPLALSACASDPRFAENCNNSIGCGSVVVNPNFGPIQAQAVAPRTGDRFPFE
jgi:hypothetical protein